ncbi:tripartite motif-containing protein 16-like [Amphiprion ocellaris]|uniref:Tripartite motif-containing protein 16-like n=1 Tax=Amphiprion ocellaris TaxID=80972 RepID=A0AAQ5XD84_AMPOC|nr:tripartite motif-containing protein 16-like [Amphiprion ocellaris]
MTEPHTPVKMNHLCCSICSEFFRNPATIPCGHNFCMLCIQSCWDNHETNNRLCSCPECDRTFPSRPQLIKNTTLAEIVRDKDRRDSKKRQRSGESQQELKRPRRSTETSRSTLCLKHKKPLDVYCCTDEQIICSQCTSAQHQGHRIGLVIEERRRKQEELRSMQTKIKQILQKQETKRENMSKMFQQIEDEAMQTVDDCESIIVGVIDSLQKHFLSVKRLITAQGEAAAAQVHDSLRNLKVKVEELKKRDAELDHLAQNQSNIDFLQKWPSVRLLCEEDHLHPSNEDPLLSFKFTNRAMEQLGRQLEEFCDKEFALISQTIDSGEQQESEGESEEDDMQQRCEASVSQSRGLSRVYRTLTKQKVEPKTREDFLQYACELSLDSSTAHEDLIVFEGDKEVMLRPQKCKNPSICYPQRFTWRRQVLCRERLQAERCYYEVEVEGGMTEIALAYKGINRKSRTQLSAFGGDANSWSLDRSSNYSVSHKSDSIQLTAPPSHPRIGVYLKFKEGTLSFYEVSDSMKFLYKVEAEFTEPLYAGFWLGEKCRIRICDLRQN